MPPATASETGLRVLHQELLQFGVLIIVQVHGTDPFECGRFDEREHRA
jgi:hypothetical protein